MGNIYSTHRRPPPPPPEAAPTNLVPEVVLRSPAPSAVEKPDGELARVLAASLARAPGPVSPVHANAARALPAHVVEAFLRGAAQLSPQLRPPGPAARLDAAASSSLSQARQPRAPPPSVRAKAGPADRCWPQPRTKSRAEAPHEHAVGSPDDAASTAKLSGTPSPRSIAYGRQSDSEASKGYVARTPAAEPSATLALRRLSLAGCETASDEGLTLILRATNLTHLSLERCAAISDAAMSVVARQSGLRELVLDACKRVGSTGVRYLGALDGLRVISLARCVRLDDDGLCAGLQAWKRLRVLSVALCFRVTGKALAHAAGCPDLTCLDVRSTAVDSDLWSHTASLTKLRVLLASGTDVGDEDAGKLSLLHQLRHLDVERTRAGDGVLRAVRGMRYLETLNLGFTRVTESGVSKHVTKLVASLTWLNLEDAELGDFAAERLGVLKQLRALNLSDTNVTSFGVAGISGLQELRSLNLCFTDVTDSGLRSLRNLTKLEVLSLDGEHLTDDGVRHLSALSNLQELDLYGANISDCGLGFISKLQRLRLLELCLSKITDKGAFQVAKLPQLKFLNLSQNRLSTCGVLQLLERLSSLRTLNISYNRDVDEGIVDAVIAHPSLTAIYLQGTLVGVEPLNMALNGIVLPCDDETHPRSGQQ